MFQFKPVVRDLPTLAKTIGGKLQVVKDEKASRESRWIARIVGPRDCYVWFRSTRDAVGGYSPSATARTALLARLQLARVLSWRTFVIKEAESQEEHCLPLGRIKP